MFYIFWVFFIKYRFYTHKLSTCSQNMSVLFQMHLYSYLYLLFFDEWQTVCQCLRHFESNIFSLNCEMWNENVLLTTTMFTLSVWTWMKKSQIEMNVIFLLNNFPLLFKINDIDIDIHCRDLVGLVVNQFSLWFSYPNSI